MVISLVSSLLSSIEGLSLAFSNILSLMNGFPRWFLGSWNSSLLLFISHCFFTLLRLRGRIFGPMVTKMLHLCHINLPFLEKLLQLLL